MASKYPLIWFVNYVFLMAAMALSACDNNIKEYKSECNVGRTFKRVSFTNLMDSLNFYDRQYIEVSGKYQQGKDESALFNDSLIVDKVDNKALWIDFSQECPLYLTGTRIGFFDYDHNNGQLTPANNTTIIIRGEVNYRNKGHLKAYRGTIERISYVKL